MAHNNHYFGLGDLTGDIFYDLFTLNNKQVPFLRVIMMINGSKEAMSVEGLRIVAYGDLAELCYPYLQTGSRIAVIGHVQRRYVKRTKKEVWEVVAESLSFVRNINWEDGEAARQRLMAAGKTFSTARVDLPADGSTPSAAPIPPQLDGETGLNFVTSQQKLDTADIQDIREDE